jgi:predicted esterase
MIVPSQAERLAKILWGAGAEVELRLRDTDHGLTKEEAGEAKEWLSERIGYD